jgi:quinol-cytochrome oxidoreductase complex cytochrome b subunit
MLVPGVVFTGLLLVPWIDRHFTKDDREHHLLDRPRDAPHRTAAGAASTSFVAVLFLGGSQDVIAGTLNISIGHITAALQLAAILLPPVIYYGTWRICRALVSRPGPDRTERAGGIVRDAGGGYHEADEAEAEASEQASDEAEAGVQVGSRAGGDE